MLCCREQRATLRTARAGERRERIISYFSAGSAREPVYQKGCGDWRVPDDVPRIIYICAHDLTLFLTWVKFRISYHKTTLADIEKKLPSRAPHRAQRRAKKFSLIYT